ncbi:MAG: DUF2177 family protein [Pseudomonadota bacterium]
MNSMMMAFFGATIAFLALNLSWIGVIAQDFYQRQMGGLMASSFRMPAVAAFYLVYLAGVVFFAVAPAIEAGSIASALVRGALFGFVCYATYDLTNLATLRGYPARLAVVDIIAGTVVTGLASAAGYFSATLA